MPDEIIEPGDVAEVPADWTWTLVEITCEACGGTNELHELPPAMLEAGDTWECRHCGAKHHRGGFGDAPRTTGFVIDPVVECVECHNTYPVSALPAMLDDGTFSCPGCGTEQRALVGTEGGESQEGQR